MDVGREVLDKQMLDSDQRRCGKVDDLLLVLDVENEFPRVAGILCQQGALARDIGKCAHAFVLIIYRVLGIPRPRPVFIDWNLVDKIDVVVHLSKTRRELGLDRLQRTLRRRLRFILPGARQL